MEVHTESKSITPAEITLLRKAGLRLTPQRLAIARELSSRSHPTAAEIYDAVRRQFSTLGLATVHATLRTMDEHGLVHKLPSSGGTCYDPNLLPHVNLICTHCRRIVDIEGCDDALELLRQQAAATSEFVLQTQRVDLYGTCRECRSLAFSYVVGRFR